MGDVVQFGRRGHQSVATPFDSAALTIVRDVEGGNVTVMLHDVEGAELTPERNRALTSLMAEALITLGWAMREKHGDGNGEVIAAAMIRDSGAVTTFGNQVDFDTPDRRNWLDRTAAKLPGTFRDLFPPLGTTEG